MKNFNTLIALSCIFLMYSFKMYAQTTTTPTYIKTWFEVETTPKPQVTIYWDSGKVDNEDVRIYKKIDGDYVQINPGWLPPGFNPDFMLPGWTPSGIHPDSAALFVDTNVVVGGVYEYIVKKGLSNNFFPVNNFAGVEVPLVENRGSTLLLIDDRFAESLSFELLRFKMDLIGDGWNVITDYVDISSTSVPEVKQTIIQYYEGVENLKALILFGHIPVPYSGDVAHDGHLNHKGAWPSDFYYGDVLSDSLWTDTDVNITTAQRTANHNVPGDGKFDIPSTGNPLPESFQLQVGRIDFYDMPAFSLSETELLRQYLDKDHRYRHKEFTAPKRTIAETQWHFHESGTDLISDTVHFQDYMNVGSQEPFMWGFGSGAGTYKSAAGVGSTNNFAALDSLKIVVNGLFGSYFGDWDNKDNFLRAPLAVDGYSLISFWAWNHGMIYPSACINLGNTIGEGYRKLIKAGSFYLGMMGDPAIRLDIIAPPKEFEASQPQCSRRVSLQWEASSDDVLGYHVYRASTIDGNFERITSQLVSGTNFTDNTPLLGDNVYMIRAVKLEETANNGSYFNMSQGVFSEVIFNYTPTTLPNIVSTTPENKENNVETNATIRTILSNKLDPCRNYSVHISPSVSDVQAVWNEDRDTLTITHSGLLPAQEYEVTLVLEDSVENEIVNHYFEFETSAVLGIDEIEEHEVFTVFPSPTYGEINYSITLINSGELDISIYDAVGAHVTTLYRGNHSPGVYTAKKQLHDISPGLYFVVAKIGGKVYEKRIMKM